MMRGWQTDFGQRKVSIEVSPVQRRTGAGRQPDRSMLVRVGRHFLVGPIAVDIFTVFDFFIDSLLDYSALTRDFQTYGNP